MSAVHHPSEIIRLLQYDPDTGLLFWLNRDNELFSTSRATPHREGE